MKNLAFVIVCVGLFVLFSPHARADSTDSTNSITFSFLSGPSATINSTGVSASGINNVLISDTSGPSTFTLNGTDTISTGSASSYSAVGGVLTANFLPGGGVEVQVDSSSCGGGSMPGVCLQGSLNTGNYAASQNGTGSFRGSFSVNYVSPYVTSLFGQPNTWSAAGADSFNTSFNGFTSGGTTASAMVTGGAITFQTSSSVPEPNTLVLLGVGMVALCGLMIGRSSKLRRA
jgi:hypothetical protein